MHLDQSERSCKIVQTGRIILVSLARLMLHKEFLKLVLIFLI